VASTVTKKKLSCVFSSRATAAERAESNYTYAVVVWDNKHQLQAEPVTYGMMPKHEVDWQEEPNATLELSGVALWPAGRRCSGSGLGAPEHGSEASLDHRHSGVLFGAARPDTGERARGLALHFTPLVYQD